MMNNLDIKNRIIIYMPFLLLWWFIWLFYILWPLVNSSRHITPKVSIANQATIFTNKSSPKPAD